MASCVMAFLPTGRSRKDKATKNRGATKNQGADKGSAKYIGKRTCKGKGKDLPAPNQEWTDTIFTGVFARRVREYGWIQLDYFYQVQRYWLGYTASPKKVLCHTVLSASPVAILCHTISVWLHSKRKQFF